MSSSGLLCLKWNNHTSAFDKLLNNLHLKDVYSDGTIVCHGKFYPVHRFVLSTCSEYFEEIFRQSINLKSKHPFIIVKDIHPPQIEALLNYMYRGEVNVPQEMLPELIKAAEAFKIKGLAVPDDEPPPSKSSSSRDRKRSSANLASPNAQIKKSRRGDDDCTKSAKDSFKSDDDIKQTECSSIMSKNSSISSQNETNKLFIPDILPSEVKSEPSDLPDYSETEVIPDQVAPPEDDYLSPKELGIKDEKSFDSYPSAEPFPPYVEDEDLPTDDQYDLDQSSSWDNSQGFEGDGNLEETDSAQGVGEDFEPWLSSSGLSGLSDGNAGSYTSQTICDVKIYKCSVCSYQNSREGHVKKHLRKHTGEKPFHCPHCYFKSSQKGNLQKHIKALHNREKPYHCPQCSFKSSRKSSLQQHIAMHTGEKRYQCSHCSYSAIQKGNFLKHLRKHSSSV